MPPDPLPQPLETGSTVRVLAPGDLLFRQGDPAAAIYKVESGRLRLIRRTVDDHLVILHTARRGEFFAAASLFADAVATAPSSVRVYPKQIVMEAMRKDPALAEAFMARMALQLQDLRARPPALNWSAIIVGIDLRFLPPGHGTHSGKRAWGLRPTGPGTAKDGGGST